MLVQLHNSHRRAIANGEVFGTAGDTRGLQLEIEAAIEGFEYVRGILVASAVTERLCNQIAQCAPYKTAVLISGETGTGKDMVARAVHALSGNPKGPYVICNCANLVETLAESQLFGHVRGAFTDAREDSLGYFRSAHGGTLFLDEIGELPAHVQPKLLRALELGEVQPVGSARTYHLDVKVVAASNRDLAAMVANGQFRADLYYRFAEIGISIPPLRERRTEIPKFVAHFANHYGLKHQKQVRRVTSRAIDALVAYNWPGNVREIAHAVEYAVLFGDGESVDLEDLPDRIQAHPKREPAALPSVDAPNTVSPHRSPDRPGGQGAPLPLDETVKESVIGALANTGGNRRRAALLLGISRPRLYRLIERYQLEGVHLPRPRSPVVHAKLP